MHSLIWEFIAVLRREHLCVNTENREGTKSTQLCMSNDTWNLEG